MWICKKICESIWLWVSVKKSVKKPLKLFWHNIISMTKIKLKFDYTIVLLQFLPQLINLYIMLSTQPLRPCGLLGNNPII